MLSDDRLDELSECFWSETNEDWTQEWRDYLTAEESALVDEWDAGVAEGMYKIAKRILELDKKRRDKENRD